MHTLFLALEFAEPIFSGSGVYARALVDILLACGAELTVICGTTASTATDPADSNKFPVDSNSKKNLTVIPLSLSLWDRLDRHSGCEESIQLLLQP